MPIMIKVIGKNRKQLKSLRLNKDRQVGHQHLLANQGDRMFYDYELSNPNFLSRRTRNKNIPRDSNFLLLENSYLSMARLLAYQMNL